MATRPLPVDYKAPGGKLLRVTAAWEDGRLAAVTVAGDFFCHPEAAVDALESRLLGAAPGEIPARLRLWQAESGAVLYGWRLEDLAEALRRTR